MPRSSAACDEGVEVVEGAEARGGWRCGRPRRRRWPTGCRGRRGRRRACCCGPCGGWRRWVDRRQVHDVEAHAGDGGQPLVGRRPQAALGAGEQLVPAPRRRPAPGRPTGRWDRDGVRSTGSGTVARRAARSGWRAAASRASAAGSRRASAAFSRGRPPALPASDAATSAARRSSSRAPSSSSTSMSWPAPLLDEDVVPPGGEAVGPRLDAQLVAAEGGRLDGGRPPVVAERRPWARTATSTRPPAATAPGRPGGRGRRGRCRPRRWWAAPMTALAGYLPVGVRGRGSSMTIRPVTSLVYHRPPMANPPARLRCRRRGGYPPTPDPDDHDYRSTTAWICSTGKSSIRPTVRSSSSVPDSVAEAPRRRPPLGDDHVVGADVDVLVRDPPVRPRPTLGRVGPGLRPVAPVDVVPAGSHDRQRPERRVRLGKSVGGGAPGLEIRQQPGDRPPRRDIRLRLGQGDVLPIVHRKARWGRWLALVARPSCAGGVGTPDVPKVTIGNGAYYRRVHSLRHLSVSGSSAVLAVRASVVNNTFVGRITRASTP